ncbi:MAG: hypothetical protein Q7T73_08610 [Beijerinckiaceae bacterium]|nr:hypothetical protein [Beijerinckiaceae bacterium]
MSFIFLTDRAEAAIAYSTVAGICVHLVIILWRARWHQGLAHFELPQGSIIASRDISRAQVRGRWKAVSYRIGLDEVRGVRRLLHQLEFA